MRTINPVRLLEATAVIAAIVGAVTLFIELPRRPVFEAAADGITLRMASSHWLADHMDHGTGFEMPSSMTPGMPPPGTHRLSVEMIAFAHGGAPVRFDPLEVVLEGEKLGSLAPTTDLAALTLRPGEQVSAVLEYDVPGEVKEVALVWKRPSRPALFLAGRTPDHPERGIPARWSDSADGLPPGDAAAGKRIYVEAGCVSCHGDPSFGVDANLGPALAGIANAAGSRVPGASAVQYLYDSILEPDEFIAPACAYGEPCITPSAMPTYAQRLEPQELADVIAYLLEM